MQHQSVFRATQSFFNQYNTYLYIAGTIFSNHVFPFSALLNVFSQHEPPFWVSHNFLLLPQHIFCDSHDFGGQCDLRNIYFVDTTYFLVHT